MSTLTSGGRAALASLDAELAYAAFERHYAHAPRWLASAPGRVNLIGEYTDYNGGYVLPMAIEPRTIVAAAPNDSRKITVHSEALAATVTIDLTKGLAPDPRGRWSNYLRGVVCGFLKLGALVPGFNALIHSTVPVGAGLSSSAALETSIATLLEAMAGMKLEPLQKIALCQTAEHVFAGVPCGIMDPYICTLARAGHALLLDCRSQEAVWLPFEDPEVAILIVNTQVRHELAQGEYAMRRRACEEAARALKVATLREASLERLRDRARDMSDTALRCARHVITEIARTERAAQCIAERDWHTFGELLDASHESLKSDFNVSSPELDLLVGAARDLGPRRGVYGARLTGGGFGGCAIALIEARKREEIRASIAAAYQQGTGLEPQFLISRPSAGVSILEV